MIERDVWKMTVLETPDLFLLSFTRMHMAREQLDAVTASTALLMDELNRELELLKFAEDLEFAELEESFWSSY